MLPEITTSAPGFMGSTEDHDKEFVERKRASRTIFETGGKPLTIYIHGMAEARVGFDVPIFLCGDVVEAREQPIILWMPDGSDNFLCTLVMEERKNRWYGLVVLPHEVADLDLSKCDGGS